MKLYNFIGYAIILLYALACVATAPPHLGPWAGLLIGAMYFIFCWFLAGVYLSDVIHLGIAHRSLDYKEWFMKTVTVVNNTFGIYVDPVSWVNRHRLHHKHADHDRRPNKLQSDGFWRTMCLCVLPYQCSRQLWRRRDFEVADVSGGGAPVFAILAQSFQFLSRLEAGRRREVCAGDVVWNADFCAVGQYDPKLLDPHPRLWIPTLSR